MEDYRNPPAQDRPDDDVEIRRATVDEAMHGTRLDRWLALLVTELSRSYLQQLIERGHVRIGARVVDQPARRVQAGDSIEIELLPTEQSRAFRPEPIALDVRFEDEHLLVIHKPAGLVVHPAAGHWSGTLLNGLLARDACAGHLPRAGIVHRLDKDTSGLMVVGRTLEAVTALTRALAARELHRGYLALVHGDIGERRFSIDAAIGRDPVSRVRMAVTPGGKSARTDVDRVAARNGFSALRCTLHSGRTHQIRVHLASRGHPIVADALYGGSPALGMTRQALHAVRLELSHPQSGEPMVFEAPPPADFEAAWRSVAQRGQGLQWRIAG